MQIKDKKQIYKLLNDTFSPDKVENITPDVFAHNLMESGIIHSVSDFNFLVLESIQKAYVEDDEFPIRYYHAIEEISETGRIVTDIDDCLTDDYIAAHFINPA